MKKKYIIPIILFVTVFFPFFVNAQSAEVFRQEGIASWYGKEFDGRPTASGEIYDSTRLTAAHPNLPFGTIVEVTNRHNNKKVNVRINDRGPFVSARVIDISRAAADQLDMVITGTAPVFIESVDRIAVQTVNTPIAVNAAVNGNMTVIPGNEIITHDFIQQAVSSQSSLHIKLMPEISINQNKIYRLQVGSFRVARYAVDTFERLKSSGLNPSYERHIEADKGEFFRVVLAGVPGTDIQLITEKLKLAGFKEALIREEI
ncbi:MAG: septal ring lytic transglycosylase RlpA family protein [Treponema sp.]|nr:septal ring lytic transglycosylase RlpA family protein [Treponema sp.]